MIFVSDIMTIDLVTLTPSDSLKQARTAMESSRIRHLPILSSSGSLVGLLTQRDLLQASISRFADVQPEVRDEIEDGIPISVVMQTNVLTVSPNTPIPKAGSLLLSHKYSCLPVLDDNALVGILTESDFVRLCLALIDLEEA